VQRDQPVGAGSRVPNLRHEAAIRHSNQCARERQSKICVVLDELTEEPYPQDVWDQEVEAVWQFVYKRCSEMGTVTTSLHSSALASSAAPGHGGATRHP
jgi:hypothetical protein